MIYVFVTYNFSLNFDSPESWFKRTEAYVGVLHSLTKQNTVINIKQINYEGDCVHKGIQYRFVNFGEKETRFPKRLNQYVKDQHPDVVFVQGLHVPLQIIQLRRVLGKKVKIIVQNHAEQPLTGLKKYLQRMADRRVDAYLFASQAMGMDWIKKGNLADPAKIHEVMEVSSIFEPIDRSIALEKTGAEGHPIFLWVGRLNDNKDPVNVIKTFLKFTAAKPGARLYMIYHTDELLAQVQVLLDTAENKDAVILVGKVSHDELLYWYNSADIVLSGSYYEGSGTAVCEAMSCGCMPIVTDIFSFRMITDNGRCGLLYQPGDEEGLLTALLQTRQMDVKEKQAASLEYFRSNLSFEAIAGKVQDVVASL
jgi:glycosyltransferase involved in cell wall biosynthesis